MAKLKNSDPKNKKHPYQVPDEHYRKLEQVAKERRQQTGEAVLWSTVLREIIDNHFTQNK